MSSPPDITLYDILSTLTPPAWSPNTWKARTVLNYKRIPYQTVWVSLPDIAATVKKLGCTHNRMQGAQPVYTLPVIVDGSSRPIAVVSDSREIAQYLDAKFPDRPVLPQTGAALAHAFEICFGDLVGRHLRAAMALPTLHVLDGRARAYFRATRARWYGRAVEDMSGDRRGDWERVRRGFDGLARVLDRNGRAGGEFVAGGREPTRADMILVAYLAYVRAVAPEEGWRGILESGNGGRWGRLWDRAEEWRGVQ